MSSSLSSAHGVAPGGLAARAGQRLMPPSEETAAPIAIGAHCSASGGLWRTIERAVAIEAEAVQFFGASPRATINLARAARAHAFLRRRGYVTPEDVRSIGLDVLRHRVLLTYEAEAEEVTSDDVVNRVLGKVEVP